MDPTTLTQQFQFHFNAKPELIVQAPGRVNLIGEHTDYNDGFVLPMAIDRGVWLALRPREDGKVRIFSLDLEAESAYDLHSLTRDGDWIEYPKGVASELIKARHKRRRC